MSAWERLAEVEARLQKAHREIERLTQAPGGPGAAWRWSIPAQPERDSDLILTASVGDVPALTAALRAVLALHQPERDDKGWLPEAKAWCSCSRGHTVLHPCPTVRAIEEHL